MWRNKPKPADDPAQQQRALRACVSTPLLVVLLLGKPNRWIMKDLDDFSEVILLRSQIGEIESALARHPRERQNFRQLLRRDFSVVDVSGFRAAEIYQQWVYEGQDLGYRPNLKWCFREFFQELDLASRLFLAKVWLTKAQVLLTDDPVASGFAKLLDLTA
jgi:hypothetical protein